MIQSNNELRITNTGPTLCDNVGDKMWRFICQRIILENHFYNRNGCFYIKVIWKWERKFKLGDVKDGWYRLELNQIQHIWDLQWTNIVNFRDRNFLITNSPWKNTTCAAKTHICMIESTSGREKPAIIGPNTVNNEIMQIAQLVYNTIQYE